MKRKSGSSWIVIILVLVGLCVLCLCLGAGGWWYYTSGPTLDLGGEQPVIPLPGIEPAPPDPRPVGLYEGLNSLNSYRLVMRTVFTGPTDLDYFETTSDSHYTQEGDQLFSRTESITSSADEPERSTSVMEEYRLGQTYCQRNISDGETESELSTATPIEQAMRDALLSLFDVNVAANNAQFVGSEAVSGIPADHFTFTVSGLGASGAEVTQSQGEYWVAQDGRYLLKYQVVMEMRSGPPGDPASEVYHVEMQIDLSEINLPFSVQMPADCGQ